VRRCRRDTRSTTRSIRKRAIRIPTSSAASTHNSRRDLVRSGGTVRTIPQRKEVFRCRRSCGFRARSCLAAHDCFVLRPESRIDRDLPSAGFGAARRASQRQPGGLEVQHHSRAMAAQRTQRLTRDGNSTVELRLHIANIGVVLDGRERLLKPDNGHTHSHGKGVTLTSPRIACTEYDAPNMPASPPLRSRRAGCNREFTGNASRLSGRFRTYSRQN
jgi:hypothetical protein